MKRTLKTVILVAFSCMLLFVLTGCANVNYEIKLEKDGSGDVSYIMGYDKSFLKSMNVSTQDLGSDDAFDEMKQEATEDGYTVEVYEDDNTYGFKAYKHVNNIQDEFKIDEGESESNPEDGIKYSKTLFKTKYSQEANVDLKDVAGDDTDSFTTAIMNQMKISYKIVLPFKAGDNNATNVSEDGKTLEWTLKAGQSNEIKFVAEQDDYTVVAIAGIAIVLVIIVVGVVVSSKKNAKKETSVNVAARSRRPVEEPKKEAKKPAKEKTVKTTKTSTTAKKTTKKAEPKTKTTKTEEPKKDDNKEE